MSSERKTPIEQLIKELQDLVSNGQFGFEFKMGLSSAIGRARGFLEKEKFGIETAFHNGGLIYAQRIKKSGEEYFNEMYKNVYKESESQGKHILTGQSVLNKSKKNNDENRN